MSVLLAVLSALVWGTADYIGGHASRRAESTVVTLVGQSMGLVAVLIVIPMVGDPVPGGSDWGYGFLAGGFGGIALMCFYRALSTGAMTVVAPIAGVTCALVPAIWGIAAGDRPSASALVGVLVALVAIALVSGAGARPENPEERRTPLSAHVLALCAGLGFGGLSVSLSYTSGEGGLWPVVAMRCVSLPLTAVVALVVAGAPSRRKHAVSQAGVDAVAEPGPARSRWWLGGVALVLALVGGTLDTFANTLFLFSTRDGLLAVVGVISAMYPAATVVLAFARDRERVSVPQAAGLALAASALVLVGIG